MWVDLETAREVPDVGEAMAAIFAAFDRKLAFRLINELQLFKQFILWILRLAHFCEEEKIVKNHNK